MSSYLSGPFNTKQLDFVYCRLQTQNNLNNNPVQFREVLLDPITFDTNIMGASVVGNEFQNIPTGLYLVIASLLLTSLNARTNLQLRLNINGTNALGISSASGYIRNATGHNNSSLHINGLVQVTSTSTVGLVAQREAGNGTVTTNGSLSQLSLLKVI